MQIEEWLWAGMGQPSRHVRPHPQRRPDGAVPQHPAADGHRVPAVRRLRPGRRLPHRTRAAHRRRLPRHAFELAAILFNVIWGYARHDHRLLGTTIDAVGVRAISRRFRLALVWIATGTLLGALLPVLGMAVIASFIPYYWLPIRGKITGVKPRRDRGGQP
jgi:hypothetical protein